MLALIDGAVTIEPFHSNRTNRAALTPRDLNSRVSKPYRRSDPGHFSFSRRAGVGARVEGEGERGRVLLRQGESGHAGAIK